MAENTYNTIIVGGGIAGLTAAAYLSREGQKVLLFEKNRECGGLVNTFDHNGFQFDAGVRALEDAGIIIPMLKDIGIQLEIVKSPVSLGIENEILHIESIEDLDKYRKLLIRLFPESEGDINMVIKVIRKIMKHMDVLYGIENPVFKDLKHDRNFLFTKLLPWLPKFIFTVGKINRMNMPVEEYLQTLVKNPSLRDMISQHFFKNTPSFFALSYFSLYLDYFYPKGGVGRISEALKNKILEFGGEINTETKIVEVMANQCLVRDHNNISYKYDNLVWAADLKTLYKITKTDGLSPKIKVKFGETKNKLLKNRGGDSVFTLFLEADEPLESFRKIAHGHFFYTPSRQGLGETHRQELDVLLNNFDKANKGQILTWLDKFIRLNTYEISVPGLKDPEMVPPGKTGVIVSFLAEYDLFKEVQKAGWLDEFISELENRVLQVISDSVYPMLKDKIIAHFSFTPLSIENRVGSSEGAIVGWSFQESMPVVNKIQISDRSVFTPIPSVYQAGQWAYSPAGVPMSILTGKLAADKIIGKKNR
jgi:phytoene dehydrogenase-like protein